MGGKRTLLPMLWGVVSVLEWPAQGERAGSLPDVLLLHGGALDHAELSWGELGPRLARAGYRVIAPDAPGFGRSPRPPWPVTQERLAAFVRELVDALALRDYVLGGLSLGGGLVIEQLLARPGAARGAMLLGSYGLMRRVSHGPGSLITHCMSWALAHAGLLEGLMRLPMATPALAERSLRPLVRDAARRQGELPGVVSALAARGGSLRAFAQWQRDQLRWDHLRTDLTGQLGEISEPVLIINGERDAGVPVAIARRAAAVLPAARLIEVPGAGHWVQRDHPEAVSAAMLDFLAALGSSPHR